MRVGVCSNPSKKAFEEFDVLEVQRTFYRIIRENTARRWREKAPKDFEFVVKCFQGITHNYKSPTWRRSNIDVKEIKENVGDLKVNDKTMEFWDYVINIARVLRSKIILVQTPSSFRDTSKNIENVYRFFGSVERGRFRIAVEFRGWKPENIRKVCEDLDLIDVFDPLLRRSETPRFLYIRLHGKIEERRINYKHKYTEEELRKILEVIKDHKPREVYVLFNNVYMFEDAKRFRMMI